MTPLRKRMLDELQLRNYANFTIERYLDAVRSFAKCFHRSPEQMGPEQIREYLLHMVKDRKSAPNTVQVHRAALKFLYVKTLNQPWFDERVARTRRRPNLPSVLSAAEITRILDHTTNLKHWTIIATFYATGLRCNELRNLKIGDIDSQRMVIHVREAKGGVPRDIGLSPLLLVGASRRTGYSRPRCVLTSPWSARRFEWRATSPDGVPALTGPSRPTFFDTVAPRTCWKPALIFAPSRFCLAMPTSRPRPATCASRRPGCRPHPVHSRPCN